MKLLKQMLQNFKKIWKQMFLMKVVGELRTIIRFQRVKVVVKCSIVFIIETFISDFLKILKHTFQNFKKIWKQMFLMYSCFIGIPIKLHRLLALQRKEVLSELMKRDSSTTVVVSSSAGFIMGNITKHTMQQVFKTLL